MSVFNQPKLGLFFTAIKVLSFLVCLKCSKVENEMEVIERCGANGLKIQGRRASSHPGAIINT